MAAHAVYAAREATIIKEFLSGYITYEESERQRETIRAIYFKEENRSLVEYMDAITAWKINNT